MWKRLWKTWTIDKPAAFGDLLWEVCVVQLAAFLDRLTLRKIVALIPVVILIVAYAHSIPLPPELMLVGDVLAYIDIFSVILLLGILSRVSTIVFVVKQALANAVSFAGDMPAMLRRLDFRHTREGGARARSRSSSRANTAEDGFAVGGGLAWA
jgi:hypothetical protein